MFAWGSLFSNSVAVIACANATAFAQMMTEAIHSPLGQSSNCRISAIRMVLHPPSRSWGGDSSIQSDLGGDLAVD